VLEGPKKEGFKNLTSDTGTRPKIGRRKDKEEIGRPLMLGGKNSDQSGEGKGERGNLPGSKEIKKKYGGPTD